MPKRITYLRRRDDRDIRSFRNHWSGPHARIAVDLPGVQAYRQNHIVEQWLRGGRRIDGIVELWFRDDESANAGFASGVADRLAEDEPRFLSGLVGSAVSGDLPHAASAVKVWLLLRKEQPGPDLRTWATQLADQTHAVVVTVDTREVSSPLLTRGRLEADSDVPIAAVALGYRDLESVHAIRSQILAAVTGGQTPTISDVLVAEEVVII